jgi:starch-binding outer membrane protein, SusD/RagB family
MKTRKYNILYIFLVIILVCISCTEDWLETEPKGQFLTSNYFKTPDQAFDALVACYDVVNLDYWNGVITIRPSVFGTAADELHAGGFVVVPTSVQYVIDRFTLDPGIGPQAALWTQDYSGVFRTNYFLQNIDGLEGIDNDIKKRYIAEAKFLRARFYFDLVTFFKNIPLILEPLTLENVYDQEQVAPELVYAQIEKDLNEAMPDLPVVIPATENGRVTQGAAKAYLGKVILYQMNTSRMLEAAGLFNEVNKADNIYGYYLLPNYADVFKKDNKFNHESILEIPHSDLSRATGVDFAYSEGNLWSTFLTPVYMVNMPYAGGFGGVPVETALAAALTGDPRFNACIADFNRMVIESGFTSFYLPGADNTGYFPEKWLPRTIDQTVEGLGKLFNYPYDYIEMRLADTYLMEAEALIRGGGSLTRAYDLLNAVRARVGLTPVDATLDNILNERRLELATEGHRFFDLIRFGKAEEVLGPKGFVAGKNEILPIPLQETYNTKLVQNPNY